MADLKRGTPVVVRGTVWQVPAFETVIIQVSGGGLIAVPEQDVEVPDG